MDLVVGQTKDENYIIISLEPQGNCHYRLTSSIDNMIDYDTVLQSDEKEAIECFRNLQIKYFDRIINDSTFEVDNDI